MAENLLLLMADTAITAWPQKMILLLLLKLS